MIAVIVISFSTASLFIVLSAFSGLKTFGLSFTNKFDPDYRIKPRSEKKLILSNEQLSKINLIPSVIESSPVLENKVVLNFKGKTMMAVLRGAKLFKNSSNRFTANFRSWFNAGYSEVIIAALSQEF